MSRRVLIAAVLVAGLGWAEDRVPEELGLKVILKVASYDAAFDSHGTGDFVVLVPFGPGDEAKANAAVSLGSSLEVKSIKERPLRFKAVPLAELDPKKATALLIHTGFSLDALPGVLERARPARLYVFAFDEAAVQQGAVLGVGLANGKPQPLVNVGAARALGAEFGPVLRLARIFH